MGLIKTTERVGLKINDKKTEYIILNRREVNYRQDKVMKIINHSSKRVCYFNYVGSVLIIDNDIKVEIDTRLK